MRSWQWSELVISGRTVRRLWPLAAADPQQERLDARIVAAERGKIGTARDRVEIDVSAILPRSTSPSARTYCADPVSAHSSTLKNITRRPRRHVATSGASARVTASTAARPLPLSMADSARSWPSTCADSTTHSSVWPGIVVDESLGLEPVLPRSRSSSWPSASPSRCARVGPPSRAQCKGWNAVAAIASRRTRHDVARQRARDQEADRARGARHVVLSTAVNRSRREHQLVPHQHDAALYLGGMRCKFILCARDRDRPLPPSVPPLLVAMVSTSGWAICSDTAK